MRLICSLALFFTLFFPAAAFTVKILIISRAGPGDPFWVVEFKDAQQAAGETGVEPTMLAPETPNDIARQLELRNEAKDSGPDGIAATEPDLRPFPRPSKRHSLGIPLVAFNARPLPDMPCCP